MPLDGTTLNLATLRGSIDMDSMKPRHRLIALRDFLRSGLPNKLWNFANVEVVPECGTAGCAMGWCAVLTNNPRMFDWDEEWAEYFGITEDDVEDVFWGGAYSYPNRLIDTKPHHVADAIDQVLARIPE